jgi:hypothetical protein
MRLFSTIFLLCSLSIMCISQNRPKVFVSISEECPISNLIAEDLQNIANWYGESLELNLVFPLENSSKMTIDKFSKRLNLQGWNLILDKDQSVVQKYYLNVTPEVVILDKTNAIFYKGRVNSKMVTPGGRKNKYYSKDLLQNLELLLVGLRSTEWHEAVGCYITKRQNAP